MNSKTMMKLALTSALVAIPTTGCTTIGFANAKGMTSADKLAKQSEKNAAKAEKYLAKGKIDRAEKYAELAVEGDMTNAGHRALLARIYLVQGKFVSAERTLMDVMELDVRDPRTVVSLALTRIAQGKVDSAISLLDSNRSIVADGDYGLALALAGRTSDSVNILTNAIRTQGGNARVRQNLALALALDGKWREARLMASQDLDQSSVNMHIAEWAQYARPGAYERRVAGLLGVTPQIDAGQPVRLALANTDKGLALAAGQEFAVPVESSPFPPVVDELAPIGPAPVATSVGFAASEQEVTVAAVRPAVEAPLISAEAGPVKAAAAEPVKLAPAIAKIEAPAPVAAPAAKPAPAKQPVKVAIADVKPSAAVSGKYLVQLGAFSSAAGAQRAWDEFRTQYSVLKGFSSASSSVTVGGKKLVRLAAMGFGNKDAADQLCSRIQSRGGSCIVRPVSGQQAVRLASR